MAAYPEYLAKHAFAPRGNVQSVRHHSPRRTIAAAHPHPGCRFRWDSPYYDTDERGFKIYFVTVELLYFMFGSLHRCGSRTIDASLEDDTKRTVATATEWKGLATACQCSLFSVLGIHASRMAFVGKVSEGDKIEWP